MRKDKNLKVKIICLIFAFFTWIYVISAEDPPTKREFPNVKINITNIKEIENSSLVPSVDTKLEAKLTLMGRWSDISKVTSEGVSLNTTIVDPKVGKNNGIVVFDKGGHKIDYSIDPPTISINLEESKVSNKPVEINTIGNLEAGCIVDDMRVSPLTVYISGPGSLVDSVDKVIASIDLDKESKSFSRWATLRAYDKDGREVTGVKVSDDSAMVNVIVFKQKMVPIKAIISPSPNVDIIDYKVIPDSVVIKGDAKSINTIEELKTKSISIEEFVSSNSKEVGLEIPSGIKSDLKKVTVKADVIKDSQMVVEIPKESIVLENDHKIDPEDENSPMISSLLLLPDKINVIAKGDIKHIKSLKDSDIKLSIDLKDITKNNKKVSISNNSISDVTIDLQPDFVDLKNID